jgi:hypothetical protein
MWGVRVANTKGYIGVIRASDQHYLSERRVIVMIDRLASRSNLLVSLGSLSRLVVDSYAVTAGKTSIY